MRNLLVLPLITLLAACSIATNNITKNASWILVDDFEQKTLMGWQKADTDNNTSPYIDQLQITEIRQENHTLDTNHYLIKKPAADGIVGNRKALTIKTLPTPVNVGETYTFYTRIWVERFPNNHAFGISNLSPDEVKVAGYNAFEPTLRVTDKFESNGFKNDGTLMVKIDSDNKYQQYSKVQNTKENRPAKPMLTNTWYQIWYVVNNAVVAQGGQTYDVYLQGGEFTEQTLVYKNATFRIKREQPLLSFVANCNTGPAKQPYGNGGLAYDDIYMSNGINLTNPTQ